MLPKLFGDAQAAQCWYAGPMQGLANGMKLAWCISLMHHSFLVGREFHRMQEPLKLQGIHVGAMGSYTIDLGSQSSLPRRYSPAKNMNHFSMV